VEGQQRKNKGQDDDTHPHGILLLHPKCYLDNMVPFCRCIDLAQVRSAGTTSAQIALLQSGLGLLWRLSERNPDPSWPSWRLRLVEPNLDPLHQLADCTQVRALFNELLGQDPLRLREAVGLDLYVGLHSVQHDVLSLVRRDLSL
jgi:hypothetical protein